MTRDLTSGSPIKSILGFSLPILLGSLFQQIYSLVDSAIVGKFVGMQALAGVGSTGSIHFLIMGFVVGSSAGFCIPIAQAYGAGDYKRLRKYYTHALMISGVMAVIATILTMIFIDQVLVIMQTPDDIFDYAKTYVTTVFIGIPGILLYNILASTLRSIGDSKTPVMFLVCASILNVVLDLFFVVVLHMGVLGAGLATVISQTTSGVLCLMLILNRVHILRTEKEDWKIDFKVIKYISSIGFPMGAQNSITAIGAVMLQTSINNLGAIYVAAYTAGSKISNFAILGLDAMGITMATFAGQNYGAKKLDRLPLAVKQVLIADLIYCVAIFAILFVGSDYLALIFVSPQEVEAIACIRQFLVINGANYILLGILFVFRNTIQGLGHSSLAMVGGGTELVARTAAALFLVPTLGYLGASFANVLAWIAAASFLTGSYIYVYKKLSKKV